jgi:IS1 family transposase
MLDTQAKSSDKRGMNKLPLAKRVLILNMLVEGSSLRSISRVADVSINTVTKLLIDAGEASIALHDDLVRDVKASKVQCDEIWSFNYCKQRSVATAKAAPLDAGDVWTWTAIDADTKLIVTYAVGDRTLSSARLFIEDLKERLSNRVQITSDGHRAYVEAIEGAFGEDVDFRPAREALRPHAVASRPLQPGPMHRRPQEGPDRKPRRRPHLNLLRGAREPLDPHGQPPLHAPHERLLQKDRQPASRSGAVLPALQFRAPAQVAEGRHAGDGGGRLRYAVVDGDDCGADRGEPPTTR